MSTELRVKLIHILILAGGAVLIVTTNTTAIIFGLFFIVAGLTGLTVKIPMPLKVRKWLLMNISLKLCLLVSKDSESVLRYFILMNNKMNLSPAGKLLLLLPRCLQNSKCSQDIMSDIQNCKRCGDCQIADILQMAKPDKVAIIVVGGGRRALEKVNEITPDSVIAVACEKELIDGIKEIHSIPVMALENLRPNGPCLNTALNIEKLKEIFESYEV